MLPTISCIRKVALCILLLLALFTLTLSDSLAQLDEANRTTAQQELQQQHHHHGHHGHHAHGRHHHGSHHHQQNEQQKHQTNGKENQQQISSRNSSSTNNEINNNDDNQKQQQQQQSAEMEEESTPTSSAAAVPSRAKQLFREYLSRGMLTCTTKYVAMLQKLNKLIATAHDEYTKCQRMADKADSRSEHTGEQASSRLKAQMEMIDQLLLDD